MQELQAQIETLQLEMKRKDACLEVTRAEHDECKRRLETEEGRRSNCITYTILVCHTCVFLHVYDV